MEELLFADGTANKHQDDSRTPRLLRLVKGHKTPPEYKSSNNLRASRDLGYFASTSSKVTLHTDLPSADSVSVHPLALHNKSKYK
ncbi:hypothetical protein T265_00450 [Opisthorchis viverrini]|uniref:Uncharacterized protein n=1 Tax=Opisthorchis viverrini TaxID=6198 RepID=A0A075A242_OPIVI|nr:hypothetical protein T265_00450 [Opisthorchis viverrini]KER33778.1 hypothetical protein T265_00450 [Opisthorchis viverrini]